MVFQLPGPQEFCPIFNRSRAFAVLLCVLIFLMTSWVLQACFSNALQYMKSDSVSFEEQEVLRMIRECLDLRGKYVFREKVDPWRKSSEKSDLADVNSDPFNFVPVEASSVSCPFFLTTFQKLSS